MHSLFRRERRFQWPRRRSLSPRAKSRRLAAGVEGLESRGLMTGGSVVLAGGLVSITPSTSDQNVAVVSYANVNGSRMLDVNLNGADIYFKPAQVAFVYYLGSGIGGAQTFQNTTGLHTVAWGGSGANLFVGGTGSDEFVGGSGSNTFDAGTGFDLLIGGTSANVFNENPVGSGIISEFGNQNTVNTQPGSSGRYQIYF